MRLCLSSKSLVFPLCAASCTPQQFFQRKFGVFHRLFRVRTTEMAYAPVCDIIISGGISTGKRTAFLARLYNRNAAFRHGEARVCVAAMCSGLLRLCSMTVRSSCTSSPWSMPLRYRERRNSRASCRLQRTRLAPLRKQTKRWKASFDYRYNTVHTPCRLFVVRMTVALVKVIIVDGVTSFVHVLLPPSSRPSACLDLVKPLSLLFLHG